MPLGILFWVLMLLWMLNSWWVNAAPGRPWWTSSLLEFLLFATIGWKVFGAAVQ
jgi:hypothetical protein